MTEQRAYEQRLRAERDFTEQVLETVPISVFKVDGDADQLGEIWVESTPGDGSTFTFTLPVKR